MEVLSDRRKFITRIEALLAKSYNLAILTGTEVLVLVLFDEHIYHYATESLDPIINEDRGRKLIIKLLAENAGEPINQSDVVSKEDDITSVDTDSSQFIVDVDSREKVFKEQVAYIIKECQDISLLKKPLRKAEVLFLVAVQSSASKIISWATPKLEPLIKTEQGKKLIEAVLITSAPPISSTDSSKLQG